MDMSQLENAGLKDKEAKIYIALLKEGPSLANSLAKKVNILRSSIYDYLDILLDKGFISYTIKLGKKYFQAVAPERILDKFTEQRKIQENSLRQIIPELINLRGRDKNNVNVEVFEGKEGMKSVFSCILREKPKEILVHGSSGVSYKVLPFFMENWHRERAKKKIPIRIIYNGVPESRERLKIGPEPKLMNIKFAKLVGISVTGTIIYNNTILITIWDSEMPLAISIASKEVSQTYKKEFEELWKRAKK